MIQNGSLRLGYRHIPTHWRSISRNDIHGIYEAWGSTYLTNRTLDPHLIATVWGMAANRTITSPPHCSLFTNRPTSQRPVSHSLQSHTHTHISLFQFPASRRVASRLCLESQQSRINNKIIITSHLISSHLISASQSIVRYRKASAHQPISSSGRQLTQPTKTPTGPD
jgi:hypothetical protein